MARREYKCPNCGNYLGSTDMLNGGASKVCNNCHKRIKITYKPGGIYCAVQR